VYFSSGKELVCKQCGKQEIANICCPNGHYICDACHGKDFFATILDYILATPSPNPFEIAEKLMDHAKMPMLGCEHAWIAAGAFMASLKNHGCITITDDQIREVLNRTRKQAIGGYCGLTGICGIVPALGACFSVILGAACPKDRETATTMKVAGRIVQAIADQTGPCCCKNFVRTALTEAVKSADEYLNITMPFNGQMLRCTHSARHPHGCRIDRCSFYKEDEMG